jgi:hypothetical protein
MTQFNCHPVFLGAELKNNYYKSKRRFYFLLLFEKTFRQLIFIFLSFQLTNYFLILFSLH